ncbi:glutathione synthase, partial [Sarracenia purpurea var. burkii]
MMGKKAIEAAHVFVEETGLNDFLTAEDFLIEREDMLQSLFPTSELMPGASCLIKHLHTNGIPICVATGSHRRHFELKTQRHRDLFSLMHHVVLGDDAEVKRGKPSPDIFLAAAKRFEGGPIDPQNILVFEDAPAGVCAAKSAGIKSKYEELDEASIVDHIQWYQINGDLELRQYFGGFGNREERVMDALES